MANENIWIVVKNTENKNDPRVASLDYVAEVNNESLFDTMLQKQCKVAYRARSYGRYFPNWDKQIPHKI